MSPLRSMYCRLQTIFPVSACQWSIGMQWPCSRKLLKAKVVVGFLQAPWKYSNDYARVEVGHLHFLCFALFEVKRKGGRTTSKASAWLMFSNSNSKICHHVMFSQETSKTFHICRSEAIFPVRSKGCVVLHTPHRDGSSCKLHIFDIGFPHPDGSATRRLPAASEKSWHIGQSL